MRFFNAIRQGTSDTTPAPPFLLSPDQATAAVLRPWGTKVSAGGGRLEQERAGVQAEVQNRQEDRRHEVVPREVGNPVSVSGRHAPQNSTNRQK